MFDTFTGIFQPARGTIRRAVLLLSPFGYEELCTRAFWRELADELALAGIASLRFDYPGTGNALDVDPQGLEDWHAAAQAAARLLRARTGRNRVAILGQSLGATLALQWAGALGPLSELILLEPAASGRTYLRGLKAWGKTIAAAMSLDYGPDDLRDHAVAGFPLAASRAAAIQALDLSRVPVPDAAAVLLLEQAGGPVGKFLAPRLREGDVACHPFPEYPGLASDPTAAEIPRAALRTIVDWLSDRAQSPAAEGRPTLAETPPAETAILRSDGFEEVPLRFGPDRNLAGVLCRPLGRQAAGPILVMASAGRDYSIGWARSAVANARALARDGVASFRFDIGGVGDSRAAPDAPAEILYSARMCDDLRAAIDHLEGLGYGSFGLVGRCSGAWAAFTLATADARVGSLALVNLPYFLWDSSKSLADVVRFSQRRVADLGTTLLSRDGFDRLVKGQLDWRGAVRFLVRQANLRVLRRWAPFLGRLTAEARRYHDLHALFGGLRQRNVRVLLAYAAGDGSLGELQSFMGQDFRKLKRFPNVRFHEIDGADHNFTPAAPRAALLAELIAFFAPSASIARPGVEQIEACNPSARAEPHRFMTKTVPIGG